MFLIENYSISLFLFLLKKLYLIVTIIDKSLKYKVLYILTLYLNTSK